MAGTAQEDAVIDAVDRKRGELEANVNKLRNALQHWQKQEVDYGEFQEKLEDISGELDFDTLRGIRDSIDPSLLTDKEVHELLGSDKGLSRDGDQIIALLSRRMDYVQQNANALEKQLNAVGLQLERLTRPSEQAFMDEQGLPITEILEELDNNGNVISGRTSNANDAAARAAGLLDQAGVKNWMNPKPEAIPLKEVLKQKSTDSKDAAAIKEEQGRTKRKKSVAFANDVDIAPAPTRRGSSPPPLRSTSPPPNDLPPTPIKSRPSVPWEVEESRKGRFHSGTRVIELNEDDEEVGSLPVVQPEDFEESEEDARLRREMQQYALEEVGAIVAELDLEEGSEYNEDEDLEMDGDDSVDSDEENEFGMTAFDRISDEDRKQMLELEKKLQAKMMHNAGPLSGVDGTEVGSNDARRLKVQANASKPDSPTSRRSSKVHFADESEILQTPAESATSAFEDTVVERKRAKTSTTDAVAPKKKTSRFKSAMADKQGTPSIPIHTRDEQTTMPERQRTPSGPQGQVLSSSVLERPSQKRAVLPPDESGTDPALMEQELAIENRRLFNKMAQQQGGFKADPEDEDNPLMEMVDGKERKVSRFKAARINAGGI